MATGAPEAQRLAEAIAPPPGRAAVMQSLSHRCPQQTVYGISLLVWLKS